MRLTHSRESDFAWYPGDRRRSTSGHGLPSTNESRRSSSATASMARLQYGAVLACRRLGCSWASLMGVAWSLSHLTSRLTVVKGGGVVPTGSTTTTGSVPMVGSPCSGLSSVACWR